MKSRLTFEGGGPAVQKFLGLMSLGLVNWGRFGALRGPDSGLVGAWLGLAGALVLLEFGGWKDLVKNFFWGWMSQNT